MQEGQAQQVPQTEEQSQSQGTSQSSAGVFEIAILARVTWDLHSLNNEGTIGNVTEPRTIVLWDGTKTDGVSGEMMKHIHASWTWLQAKTRSLSLCPACQSFQPQRADAAPQGLNRNDNAQAMSTAITRCILCDLHGFLVQRPTIHRQSVVEFGWIVGVPGRFNRDIHVHARHAAAERGISAEAEVEEEEVSEEQTQEQTAEGARRTEVAAQMLYHRPTRSGVYALVTLFQPWRIGLNEVNYTYALNSDERTRRYQLALTAYEWTLKRPDGAMTTTRFPHIGGIEGIVLISRQAVPVPMLSPLREDYREKLKTLAEKQGIECREFNDLDELVNILSELQESVPFQMPFSGTSSGGESASAEKSAGRRRGRRRREATETPQESEESGESEEASSDSPRDTE
jgi:CRISPR-associated protein Cst2